MPEFNRIILFLLGCIGTRLSIVYLAKFRNDLLPLLGILAIIPAISFAIIFTFGLRKTGMETFGEKIWWNNIRPIHSILYGAFAYFAITKNKNAWIILLIDTLFGLSMWLNHHYF